MYLVAAIWVFDRASFRLFRILQTLHHLLSQLIQLLSVHQPSLEADFSLPNARNFRSDLLLNVSAHIFFSSLMCSISRSAFRKFPAISGFLASIAIYIAIILQASKSIPLLRYTSHSSKLMRKANRSWAPTPIASQRRTIGAMCTRLDVPPVQVPAPLQS